MAHLRLGVMNLVSVVVFFLQLHLVAQVQASERWSVGFHQLCSVVIKCKLYEITYLFPSAGVKLALGFFHGQN